MSQRPGRREGSYSIDSNDKFEDAIGDDDDAR